MIKYFLRLLKMDTVELDRKHLRWAAQLVGTAGLKNRAIGKGLVLDSKGTTHIRIYRDSEDCCGWFCMYEVDRWNVDEKKLKRKEKLYLNAWAVRTILEAGLPQEYLDEELLKLQ